MAPYCLPQQSVAVAKAASNAGHEPDPPGTEGVGVAATPSYHLPLTPPTSPLSAG